MLSEEGDSRQRVKCSFVEVYLLINWRKSGPKVIKLFSFSTQLSKIIILHIHVKMPTIVGVLTFISMIKTTSESLRVIEVFIFQ